MAMATAESSRKPRFDVSKAASRALGGGLAGAAAMVTQVVLLMPLRTTMNYQYRHGGSFGTALQKLHGDGGALRFYRGISAALVQAPLSRFGDTAANAFALSLLEQVQLPVAIKTIAASLLAGSFRIALVPIDTVKTMMQVEGKGGMAALRAKVKANGPSAMFHGALASAAATFAGHYPWFAMFNTLQEVVPKPRDDELLAKLSRNAAIGFASSVTSDTISNSLRVIKTYRQTAKETVSYAQAVRNVVASDGLSGLFFRGLSTRVLANGLQGLLFSVVWRALEDKFNKTSKPTAAAAADK